VAEAALAAIDLRTHGATHPRLGAVDHISCHPVPEDLNLTGAGQGQPVAPENSSSTGGGGGGDDERARSGADVSSSGSALERAAQVARAVGRRLSGGGCGLPVYLYGAAHPEGRRLADVRRQLGAGPKAPCYLRPRMQACCAATSQLRGADRMQWCRQAGHPYLLGWLLVCRRPHSMLHAPIEIPPTLAPTTQGYFGATDASRHTWRGAMPAALDLAHFPPDFGPPTADPRRGVLTVGAVPWIINFNVPLKAVDMAAARRVAHAVSERGGGLKGVEVGCPGRGARAVG
jgi:hypothetical protein